MNNPLRIPLACVLLMVSISPLLADEHPDATGTTDNADAELAAIEATARDYIDGWYEGDAERMERALHPDMAKRTVRALPSGAEILNTVTASNMVEYTRAGFGKQSKKEDQHNEVQILDVLTNTANVKTTSHEFIDYLQLAKINGKWWIVNVLWEPNDG